VCTGTGVLLYGGTGTGTAPRPGRVSQTKTKQVGSSHHTLTAVPVGSPKQVWSLVLASHPYFFFGSRLGEPLIELLELKP
jgi:hypothetical protein